jgi:two-component system CheB/CheR fusion protein
MRIWIAAFALLAGYREVIAPGTLEWLRGDDARLRQVLINLAGNAVKFTDSGKVAIGVGLEEETGDVVLLHFTVRDTGLGIPAEKQAVIFAPFEQVDASVARRFGGTGLGVAIAAKLVGLMDGRIWLESPGLEPESNRHIPGSAFHFTAGLARPSGPRPELAHPTRSMRVLVVDENAMNRRLACHLLAKRGQQVQTAEDGMEALAKLAQEPIDLVLMDIQMPRMDGISATRLIREKEPKDGRPPLKIVAMTAHALSGDREQCLGAGMDGYITKPLQVGELDRVLAEAERPTRKPD